MERCSVKSLKDEVEMKKVLTIIGARPQFVKAAVLSRALREGYATAEPGICEVVVHTGQHTDAEMSGQFFADLDMRAPQHQLVLTSSHPLARAGEMLMGLAEIVGEERPDAVLVYGDTDSTLAGAWAAARLGLSLIHIEAGLRSGDRGMPEEVNRIGTDHWATHLCCPSSHAVNQLRAEGIRDGEQGKHVAVVGDLQCAAALAAVADVAHRGGHGPAVLTMHRPANVDDAEGLKRWLDAIAEGLGARSLSCVFPVHPRTRAVCERLWGDAWKAELTDRGIQVVPPAGHQQMMEWVVNAPVVLTDSGGLQKEAFVLGTKCLVLRPVTEWDELVSLGGARCVARPEALMAGWSELEAMEMREEDVYQARGAGERLAKQIAEWLF